MPSTSSIGAAAVLPLGNVVDNPVSAANTHSSTLTQNDFLKLLVAQMSAQDPLNPQSNSDFAAQMAQFSALQTSQATQSDISGLQASGLVQQANGLIGRSVKLLSADGTVPSGVVTGVQMVSGVPKIVVNGTLYDMSNVLSISAAPPVQSPSPVTPMPTPNPTPAPTRTGRPALPPQPANPYAL
jgi:flagellar basal-body rod modification protein FlgD